MDKSEMAMLLTTIKRFDNRTFDAATVEAWHMAIGDLDYADCVAAVLDHKRTRHEYLEIVHICEGATRRANHRRALDRERESQLKELAAAAEAERSPVRGPVENRSADVTELLRELAAKLGPGKPKALRYVDPTLQRYQPRAAADPNPNFRGFGPVPVPGDNESENPS